MSRACRALTLSAGPNVSPSSKQNLLHPHERKHAHTRICWRGAHTSKMPRHSAQCTHTHTHSRTHCTLHTVMCACVCVCLVRSYQRQPTHARTDNACASLLCFGCWLISRAQVFDISTWYTCTHTRLALANTHTHASSESQAKACLVAAGCVFVG